MVFYFSPDGHSEDKPNEWLIYMGKDKFENEDLIKYGWPEDVWFHVDNLSSAHVYLRLPRGASIDDIPAQTLEDCCQLVKANSIQGCKDSNVDIVYTLWSNLRKKQSMEVGQVGFHNQKAVKKYRVEKKDADVLRRVNKSKAELYPDLAAQREAYDRARSAVVKQQLQKQKVEEKQRAEEKREQAELRSYKGLMDEEKMVTNRDVASKYQSAEDFEDDFM